MYALMKDCWQKEPEKRLEFTTISMRLKYPYHNYDVPPASDLTEEAEELKDKEAAEPGKDRVSFVKVEQVGLSGRESLSSLIVDRVRFCNFFLKLKQQSCINMFK